MICSPRASCRFVSVWSVRLSTSTSQPDGTERTATRTGTGVESHQSLTKSSLVQTGMPVWTSELFVSDWWLSTPVPVRVAVRSVPSGWEVDVDNRTDHTLTNLQLALGEQIIALGEVPSSSLKTFKVSKDAAIPLRSFVRDHGANFQGVVGSRQRALGASESGQIFDLPNSSVAASFLSQIAQQPNYGMYFIAPPGLDLSPAIEQGTAVLLAWAADYSPVKPMYQFTPRRSHRHTLWRIPVAIQ